MTDRLPSRTAQAVAGLRAAHQIHDAEPRILEDAVILALLGDERVREIRETAERFQDPLIRGLRAHVVLRSRVAEDHLAAAVARGVRQYVILGAGFDTFAYRQPTWARALRIVEVDQPATQGVKRERLEATRIAVPSNVVFAAVDFETESLDSALARYDVRMDEATFFSWLGVTMYLREPAIDEVLRTIARFAPGSEIVFTFAQPVDASDPRGRGTFANRAAEVGEPWLTYFEPYQLNEKLRGFGYSSVDFVMPGDVSCLFGERTDDLPAPDRISIVSARR